MKENKLPGTTKKLKILVFAVLIMAQAMWVSPSRGAPASIDELSIDTQDSMHVSTPVFTTTSTATLTSTVTPTTTPTFATTINPSFSPLPQPSETKPDFKTILKEELNGMGYPDDIDENWDESQMADYFISKMYILNKMKDEDSDTYQEELKDTIGKCELSCNYKNPVVKMIDNTVFIKLRSVAAVINGRALWDSDTSEAILAKGKKILVFKNEIKTVISNGKKQKMNYSADIISDYTYVPLDYMLKAIPLSKLLIKN